MKICGVIAEYNPFHSGHALQLAETRKILGNDTALVCLMSGNYVQRGDLAVLPKYRRAQAAALCGADLVLELPLGAALSSAEGFAQGAVETLNALGAVGYLSFGSECGSACALLHAAAALDAPGAVQAFHSGLQKGLSYAAARQQSLQDEAPEAAALLASPNNILGLEYCRAIKRTQSMMTPLSIRRRGAAHDSAQVTNGPVSASYLRKLLQQGALAACSAHMPEQAYTVLWQAVSEGAAPVSIRALDRSLLSQLRRMRPEDLAAYEQPDEGLTHRLAQAIRAGTCWEDVCGRAQTRRYPLSRIRRALLRAYLDLPLAACRCAPAYLRVLAIGPQGRALLRLFAQTASIPLITKPLHEKTLPAHAQETVQRDILADELYALALPYDHLHAGGSHFRMTPFCIPDKR